MQAVLRVRRERAGRTPPNLLGTPNAQGQGQEVGPCGLEERRPEEFWIRDVGNRTMALGLLTWELIDVEGQGQDQVPPYT